MSTAISKLWKWSASLLKRRPVFTNCVIYATFYTAAEMSQQTFSKYYTPEKTEYDLTSAARIVSIGTSVYAPSLYFCYRFLDSKYVGTTLKAVATKVAADQFFMTPILLATFYSLIAYVEKKDIREFQERYWTSFWANQAFWIPGQTINFYLVPAYLRVVYVASASFIWINMLCFIKRQKVEVPLVKY